MAPAPHHDAYGSGGTALCLLSGRGGCDAQMLAVARQMGLASVHSVSERAEPSIVMSTGPERSHEAVKHACGLGIPAIGFGDPRSAAASMDLVVTTPQFQVQGSNVLALPFAISPHGRCDAGAAGEDADLLRSLARPIRVLLVGGTAGPWRITPDLVLRAVARLSARPGTTVVLTSRRTPQDVLDALTATARQGVAVDHMGGVRLRMVAVLRNCDEVHVTGDSVSIVSEAAAAGRPVSIILPHASSEAIADYLRLCRSDPATHGMPGDLRRFWRTLPDCIATPRAMPVAATMLHEAVAAVLGITARHDRRMLTAA